MAELEKRLRSPKSGVKMAPVTAITTRNQLARKKEREKCDAQEKQMEIVDTFPLVKVSDNKAKNVTSYSDVIPTLRLRLEELESATHAETAVAVATTAATRSKSPSRRPRQAVTKPRRKQQSSPNVAATTATPSTATMTELTSKTSRESLQLHRLTFDDWLLLKEKQDARKRRDDRRELNRLSHMQQMRQQLSEKCYADWLRAKRKHSSNSGSCNMLQQAAPTMLVEASRRRAEQTKRTVQQWERRKLLEMQRQREQQTRERHEQQVRDHLRRQLSQLAWHRWLQQQDKQQQQQQQQQQEKQERNEKPHRQRLSSNSLLKPSMAGIESLYLHVPLSAAQHSLRQRLDSIDGLNMQRRK